MQSKEIAVSLGRSTPTIESCIRSLFDKLDARTRAELVAIAIWGGMIEKSSGLPSQ
jgi:DNA-binding CsgD family transcriptional regulator